MVIEGEVGIGKTRLFGEFSQWATAQGSDVLVGQAYEASARLAYQPLVDAFRPRLAREHAPEDLLADVWLTELVRLFPELHERYNNLPLPMTLGVVVDPIAQNSVRKMLYFRQEREACLSC